MSVIRDVAIREPLVDTVDSKAIISSSFPFLVLQLWVHRTSFGPSEIAW